MSNDTQGRLTAWLLVGVVMLLAANVVLLIIQVSGGAS